MSRLTEERRQAVAQIVEPVGRVDSECHAQDDLEGDRLKSRVQRELSTDRPRREIAPGDGLHRVGVVLEGLRSKGASEQPPLAGVNLAVLAEQGLGTEERLEHRAVGRELVRLQAEDVTYRGCVGDDDPGSDRRQAKHEPVSILPGAPVQVALGPESVAERLQCRRQPRAGDVSLPRLRAAAGRQAGVHQSDSTPV